MREASQSDVGEGLEEETPGSCKGPRAMPLEMLGKGAPSTGKAHPKRFACGLFEGMSKNAAWLHSNSIFKITVEKKMYLAHKYISMEKKHSAHSVCLLILDPVASSFRVSQLQAHLKELNLCKKV